MMRKEQTNELHAEDGKRLCTLEYDEEILPEPLFPYARKTRDAFLQDIRTRLFPMLAARYQNDPDPHKRSHTLPYTLRFSARFEGEQLVFDCRLLRMGKELYAKRYGYRYDGRRFLP